MSRGNFEAWNEKQKGYGYIHDPDCPVLVAQRLCAEFGWDYEHFDPVDG
jgi:hypothetical protein